MKKLLLPLVIILSACSGGESDNSSAYNNSSRDENNSNNQVIDTPQTEVENTNPPIQDTPPAEPPGIEEPVADTPAMDDEPQDNPAADSPTPDTPIADTPDIDTPKEDTPAQEPNPTPGPSPTPAPGPESHEGEQMYEAQCATCHGALGDGQPVGISLLDSLQTDNIYTSIINTMPVQTPSSCDEDCANKVVAWLREINGIDLVSDPDSGASDDNGGDASDTPIQTKLSLEPSDKTFRRASLILTGEVPSQEKLSSLKDAEESQLKSEVIALMKGEGFREFIKRSANDRLLVRGAQESGDGVYDAIKPYYQKLGTVIGLRDDEGYPNYSVSMEEEPLELIAHVVLNDRPYTEILTADYTMVDKTLAVLYQTDVDPGEGWLPAKNKGQSVRSSTKKLYDSDREIDIPHAGILTSTAYNLRWPSTATNRNRARAKYVLLNFLGFDIEAIASREFTDEELADTNNPTLNNPACAQCHEAMDPIAGTFQNVGMNGIFLDRIGSDGLDALDPTYVKANEIYTTGDRWYADMREPGYYGAKLNNADGGLPWLAEQLVNDPRFADGAVKFWWPALFGEELFHEDLSSEQKSERQITLQTLANNFVNSGYDLKGLLADMIMSNWYRVYNTDAQYEIDELVYYSGGFKLLSPEEISNKASSVTGVEIKQYQEAFNNFYGGINSHSSILRARELEPLMYQVAQRVALDNACNIVASEFNKPIEARRLFTHLERNDSFDDNTQRTSIKSQTLTGGSNFDVLAFPVNAKQPIKIELKESGSKGREIYIGRFAFIDDKGEIVENWTAEYAVDNYLVEGSMGTSISNKHTGNSDARKLNANKTAVFSFTVPDNAIQLEISSWRKNNAGKGKTLSTFVYSNTQAENFSVPGLAEKPEFYTQMTKLIERFHGQEVEENSDIVQRYMDLYSEVHYNKISRGAKGTLIESNQYCTFKNPEKLDQSVWAADPQNTLGAWQVVIATLMSGYHFIYE